MSNYSNYTEAALTGLNAANARLESISNNLSNANTTGYKEEGRSFSSIYLQSGMSTNGAGTKVEETSYNMASGEISASSARTHMAIGGNGFFTVEDAEGTRFFTRAGDFSFDKDGNLVTSDGDSVLGFTADGNQMVPITLNKDAMAPSITTTGTMSVNLGGNAPQDTLTSVLRVTDSLGEVHDILVTFSNRVFDDATGEATWDVAYDINGETITGQQLSFDANGTLKGNDNGLSEGVGVIDMTGLSAAAKPQGIDTLDLSFVGSTGYSGEIYVRDSSTDGNARGDFSDFEISDAGEIYSTYSNGERVLIATMALGSFDNVEGLTPVSGNKFIETAESGQPVFGTSGVNGLGDLNVGYLETSNVNMSDQLVALIDAQQMYQANSKPISTAKELSQVLMNM